MVTTTSPLLEQVGLNHPTCRRLAHGSVSVAEAWRLSATSDEAVRLTCRIACEYPRNRLLRDLIRTWRQQCHKPNGGAIAIHTHMYPPADVQRAFRLVVRARRAKLITRRSVLLKGDCWLVRPIHCPHARRYICGGWLEVFGLALARIVSRQYGPRLSEPLARVRLAKGGSVTCELDVVVPLPNGKFIFVEAKTGTASGKANKLSTWASHWGLKQRYAVLLVPNDQTHWLETCVQVGPHAYVPYLHELFRRASGRSPLGRGLTSRSSPRLPA